VDIIDRLDRFAIVEMLEKLDRLDRLDRLAIVEMVEKLDRLDRLDKIPIVEIFVIVGIVGMRTVSKSLKELSGG